MTFSLEETLGKLQRYSDSSFPIFSVYQSIPPEEKNRGKKLTKQFQSLIETTLKRYEIGLYQQDINYIDAYLRDCKHNGDYKGLALFSGGNKLWEVITLTDKLPNVLSVSHSPNLKPLMNVLARYRRYLVVLADREKARFFTLHMGHLESQGGVENNGVPQKVRAQGSADLAKDINHHTRDHLNKHFTFIGQKVNEFVKNKPIAGVIIGGHKEIMRNIRQHLPKQLQQKVVGEFISELNINMNQILRACNQTIAGVNLQLNQERVW